jgi:uncharacterized Zn finger protein
MSHWEHWYPSTSKRPPPKRGIKAKLRKADSTWWGKRWVDALERMSRGYSSRLARGRTYARAGRTHDLVCKAGEVTAKVTGSRATPYKVRITLDKLPEGVWTKGISAMAAKAQFAAELLARQMPREIDDVFREAGASLFPAKEADLQTSCSCPDWANPCKHVAATHYVLGEALDRDPFLLFELRGRTQEQILGALRAARADSDSDANYDDAAEPTSPERRREQTPTRTEVATISLGKLKRADYDKPRQPLPALHSSFETPPMSGGAVIRQLGAPVAWSSQTCPADMFGPILREAANLARSLALAESESEFVDETAPLASGPVEVTSPRTTKTRTKKSVTRKQTTKNNAAKAETATKTKTKKATPSATFER